MTEPLGWEAIDAVFDDMVDLRRAVHRQPELAFAEHATTALIRDRMADLHITEAVRVGETGGIFAFDGGRPGRTVVMRADIDGLPVHENETNPFHSEVEGTMHACGHDVHTAALLGVATALSARRDALPGRYVFVFQPGEEALSGAKSMIKGGALDAMIGARLVGFHVASVLPVGLVGLRGGVAMSEAHSLRFSVAGPGGHGAIPNAKGDVIKATADLVSRLGTVVDGLHYEGADCICSAGTLSAGTAVNVVPTAATVTGTLRTFTDLQREEAFGRLRELCATIGDLHGVTVDLTVPEQTPAVVNDGAVTDLVEAEAQAAFGTKAVFRMPPTSPSDDVSEFLNNLPGCYFFVGGARADGTSGMHHSPTFAVEDESLRIGATLVLRSAIALAAP
ncbi:MAG TPA: M20 family metallopeptidase [Acidimicrobiales bacterium]|nr:M20 family metallopeptidase [Acidimicrobiales bacterium]